MVCEKAPTINYANPLIDASYDEIDKEGNRSKNNINSNNSTYSPANTLNNEAYRPKSKINYSKSKVRFSIPVISEENNKNSTFRPEQMSPSRIVFPNDIDTDNFSNENDLSVEKNNNASKDDFSTTKNDDLKILSGYLVDMKSKAMVSVPEEVWNFHKDRNIDRPVNNIQPYNHHQKSHSVDNSNASKFNKKSSHNRSKSLQSIIANALVQYKKNSDFIDEKSVSTFPNGPKLQISSRSNNVPLLNPLKSSSKLYLTTDSPINKQTVPIPLEIELPPFLSPANKNKSRNSLIYDGEAYNIFKEDELSDNNISLSESSMELLNDSNSISSIPSATFNISFDVNTDDPDKLLGIDEGANVNLKLQNKNLRKPKLLLLPKLPVINITNSHKHPEKILEKATKNIERNIFNNTIPNLLHNEQEFETEKLDLKDIKAVTMGSIEKNRQNDKTLIDNEEDNHFDQAKKIEPDVSILELDFDKSNSLDSITSVITITSTRDDSSIVHLNNSDIIQTCSFSNIHDNKQVSPMVTNESIQILTTPSKIITIPDLDSLDFRTPETVRSTPNKTLKFFDKFESSVGCDENPEIFNTTRMKQNATTGTLNSDFRFPLLKNVKNNDLQNAFNLQIKQNDNKDGDFQKISANDKEFEERRLKLVSDNLFSSNGFKHVHKRNKSVHNSDELMTTPIRDRTNLTLSQFNATSTPPEIPERSFLRLKTPPQTYQKDLRLHTNIVSHEKNNEFENYSMFKKKKEGDGLILNLEIPKLVKPLSSFQSFPNQLPVESIENEFVINEPLNNRKLNLLSPRRQLSNSESQQPSITNSQFSTATMDTELTAITQSRNENEGLTKKKNIPDPKANTGDNTIVSLDETTINKSNQFNIIKEKQKDGKMVDVIILDDDSFVKSKECNFNSSTSKDKKSQKKQGNISPSKYQMISNYEDILNMCEQTAISAKETIYQLAGVTENSANMPVPAKNQNRYIVNPYNNSNEKTSIMSNGQQQRYLKNLSASTRSRPSAAFQ